MEGDNQVNRSSNGRGDERTSQSESLVRGGMWRGRAREPVPGASHFTFMKMMINTYSDSDSMNANPISMAV